jgi:gluconolactonase
MGVAMPIMRQGNIYSTGPGGLWIISPEGKQLGLIKGPEDPHNMAWGDDDGKTLYITASTGTYWIRMNITGVNP